MTAYCLIEPAILAVPPVVDSSVDVDNWLYALAQFSELSRQALSRFVLLPDGLLEALDEIGRRPAVHVVNDMLRNSDFEEVFSAEDIVRQAFSILTRLRNVGDLTEGRLLPEVHSVTPGLASSQEPRLDSCLREALAGACSFPIDGEQFVVATVLPAPGGVCVQALALEKSEENADEVMLRNFERKFPVATSWSEFLRAVDPAKIWSSASDHVELDLSLRAACESAGKACSTFTFGEEFVRSLQMHAAWGCGPYAHRVFSVCAGILKDDGTVKLGQFNGGVVNKQDASQQTRLDGWLAWRAHVSSGGVGLRLMLWKSDAGDVEFARVGPKNELKI